MEFLAGQEVVLADEPRGLAPLATEGADDPHAAERLGGHGVDLLPLLADVAEERAEPPVPETLRTERQRQQAERAEQEPPINPGQDRKPPRELHDGTPRIIEQAEDQLADTPRILAEQAGSSSRPELVDPVQRQPGRVLEHPSAHGDLHALGRPRRLPPPPEPERGPDHRDDQDRGDQQDQPPLRARQHPDPAWEAARQRPAEQHVIDHQLRRGGRDELHERGDRQGRQRQPDRLALPLEDPEELASELGERAMGRRRFGGGPSRAILRRSLASAPPEIPGEPRATRDPMVEIQWRRPLRSATMRRAHPSKGARPRLIPS